jgi:hypothetical protein
MTANVALGRKSNLTSMETICVAAGVGPILVT